MTQSLSAQAENFKNKLSFPVIVAPMFLLSTPDFALAACKEGVVGSFPALNQRTTEGLEQWLTQMEQGIADLKAKNPNQKIAPYAVNIISNAGSNPRFIPDLDACIAHKVPIIIASLGLSPELIQKVHAYGGIVLQDVANIDHAKGAAKAGVDGLIAVAAGAGGHAGMQNPMSFVSEIRSFFNGIVILAGAISTGQDILAAQVMGADLVSMGTRFISTVECGADADYKKMIRDATSSDIIYTAAVSGIPANFLKPSLEKAGFDVAQLKKDGANASKLKSFNEEAKAWKNVWSAGHGVGNINDEPSIHQLVERLKVERAQALQKLTNGANKQQNAPKPPSSSS